MEHTTGYGHAVKAYLDAGWQGVLPLERGTKGPPPGGYTGHEGAWPDEMTLARWAREYPDGNVALRLPDGVVGIDVDAYAGGLETRQGAMNRWGPLPPTWESSARDDGGGIALYRVPAGTRLGGAVGEGVQIIQHTHRYMVVWPSIHPTGAVYTWREGLRWGGKWLIGREAPVWREVPRVEDLPDLPQAWVEGLAAGREADPKGSLEGAGELMASLPAGPHCPRMERDLSLWTGAVAKGGGRHDAIMRGTLALLRLGEEGHHGAREALGALAGTFLGAVTEDGSRTEGEARAEFARELDGALRIVLADPTEEVSGDPCYQGAAINAELAEMGGLVPRPLIAGPGDPMSNARAFSQGFHGHDEHVTLVSQGGTFHGWQEGSWAALEDATVRSRLYEWLDGCDYVKVTRKGGKDVPEVVPFNPTRTKVADVEAALHAQAHLPTTVQAPSWLSGTGPQRVLVVSNGILDLDTRELLVHTPRLWTPLAVPFPYEAEAGPAKRWEAFLSELWGDDIESIQALQEWFGYVLSGGTYLHKALFIVGPPRAGKGTIARVLGRLVGPAQVAGPTLAGIGAHFGLSQLIGKTLAIIADARLRTADDVVTERLLSITGEDTQTVDRKHRDPWAGRLPTRFMMLSNEMPRLTDASGALVSRFVVLSLTHSFAGREDHGLGADLDREMPSVLTWALEGLDRLRARGRMVQPASSLEIVAEMEELASPVLAFVRDQCEIGAGFEVSGDAMWEAWKDWANEHGRLMGSTASLGRDLRAAVLGLGSYRPRVNGVQVPHYKGIRLRSAWEAQLGRPQPAE